MARKFHCFREIVINNHFLSPSTPELANGLGYRRLCISQDFRVFHILMSTWINRLISPERRDSFLIIKSRIIVGVADPKEFDAVFRTLKEKLQFNHTHIKHDRVISDVCGWGLSPGGLRPYYLLQSFSSWEPHSDEEWDAMLASTMITQQ